MNELSIHRALSRGQRRWDAMEPDYDDPPVPMPVYLESEQRSSELLGCVNLLLSKMYEAVETMERRGVVADRFVSICEEVEQALGLPAKHKEV